MLIDANVLIDLALNLQPHAARARALFDRIDQTRERAFIAWHTISNVYYVVARERSTRAAHEFIADLPSFWKWREPARRTCATPSTCRWRTLRTRYR